MNFQLLWIDALLVCLLWVATLAACLGRLNRKWLRVLLLGIVVLIPLAVLGSFVAAAAMMKFNLKIETSWFGYSVSLLLAFLIAAALILRRAARREPGFPPAAAIWRRAPLALALVIAATVGYMTLLNMDLALRARCAVQSVEVNSVYLATLPAITSDRQNAAPMYETAFARLRDDREEEQVHNSPTGDRDDFDPNEPATIAFLNHQAATIALLRRAAALPACRFDQDLADPDITAMLPGLNEERNAANVLLLHAREEIAHGRAASAIADAAAIFGMSRHFGQRPLLVSALVGMGIDALGNRTLEEALGAVKSKDELSALHLEEFPSMGRMFQQALRGEERYGLLLYGNMPASQIQALKGTTAQGVQDTRLLPSGGGLEGAFFRVFFLDSDAYLELMANLQNLSIQPFYKIDDQLADIHNVKSGRGLFTAIIIPTVSRVFGTLARVEAGDACARTAVAMTRFRLDHGTLPSHLDELVPDYLDVVPTDPFDGHPLRLAIKSDGWVIYSVGPDRIDDGGIDIVQGKGDVIFTLKSARPQAATKP